jgi:hypothetical protein
MRNKLVVVLLAGRAGLDGQLLREPARMTMLVIRDVPLNSAPPPSVSSAGKAGTVHPQFAASDLLLDVGVV